MTPYRWQSPSAAAIRYSKQAGGMFCSLREKAGNKIRYLHHGDVDIYTNPKWVKEENFL